MGRYVQLTSDKLSVRFTEPDSESNGNGYVDFPFEILRHVPNIKYLNLRVESEENSDHYFSIKFKKDQGAVEELSNAIKDDKITKSTIAYIAPYQDMVSQEVKALASQLENTYFEITESTIYIEIPPSKISITGQDANSIIVTDKATVHLNSEKGRSSVEMSINVNLTGGSADGYAYSRAIAKLRTDRGDFEAYLNSTDFYPNSYNQFPNNGQYWIQARDMDQLLTYPISLEIEVIP